MSPSFNLPPDALLPLAAPLHAALTARRRHERRALLAALPPPVGRVVLIGDSHTERGAWAELLPDVPTANRGVANEAIRDIETRLSVCLTAPAAIALQLGSNYLHGLGRSREVDAIAAQAQALVARIRRLAPTAPLIVTGVFPRSRRYGARVVELNGAMAAIARAGGCAFIDMLPVLAGPGHVLRADLTSDGLHLNGAGYRLWAAALERALREALAAEPSPVAAGDPATVM